MSGKFRRILSLILTLAMVLSNALSVNAFAEGEEHTHDYVLTDTKEPTCTEDGYTTYTCLYCPESYTVGGITAFGHLEEDIGAVAATCTTDGITAGSKCSVCGKVLVEQETIPAIGHTEVVDEAVAATCSTTGWTEGKHCSVCGEVIVAQEETAIDSQAHNYTAVVTKPTCTADGNTTYTCDDCENTYTDNVVPALGHTAGEVVVENEVEATCTVDGSYDNVVHCSVCGLKMSRETVTVPAGHTAGERVIENKVDATCTADGSYDSVVYCSVEDCKTVISRETKTVDALGHSYDTVVTAPTCTEDGYTTYSCSACGDTYVADKVTAAGHNHSAKVTAPTCTEDGYTTYTCTCGDTYTADVVAALGHTAGEAVVENDVPATCTAAGSYDNVVKCSVCKAELSRDTITVDALGHRYEAVVTAPTCTAEGYTTYTCSCGDTYTADEVPTVDHNPVENSKDNENPATCTTDGSYEVLMTCSVCGAVLGTKSVVVTAPGHTEVIDEAVAPTCTETGLTEGKHCSICNEVITPQTAVDALGHIEEIIPAVAPTCKDTGLTEGKKCSVCGEVLVAQEEVPVSEEHAYGSETHFCSVCGKEEPRLMVTAPVENIVAQIEETAYPSLQAAIDAVQNNETVILITDCAENVTFTQTADVSFVLDGNNKTMTGSINITARAGKDAPSSLVIKNFKFETENSAHTFIKSVETNYYPNNITVQKCEFKGTGADSNVIPVEIKSANNFVIDGCTATDVHSLLQNTSGWNLTVKNSSVINAGRGMSLGSVQGALIESVTIQAKNTKYGIRADAAYSNTLTIKDCTISAFIPVVIRNASAAYNIVFDGTNTMTASNTDGIWCAIGTSEYETNGAMPTAPTGKVEVTMNGTGLDKSGVYGNYGVASINGVKYQSVADALTAAQEGGLTDVTITLLGEVTKAEAIALNDSFDLYTKTEFDSVTFKQEDPSKLYYIADLYTGSRTNGGSCVFDGVNVMVIDQYIFEGNVILKKNSYVGSIAEANCFIYNGTTTVEPGSKLKGVIEDFRGGDMIVDGGKDDGSLNTEPNVQDAIMHIRWSGDKLVLKNGAYVKINSANEVGRLNLSAGTSVELFASKLDVWEYIDLAAGSKLVVDNGSSVATKKITGAGTIEIDVTDMQDGDEVSITGDLSGFTGNIEVANAEGMKAEIVDGKITLKKVVAQIGDTTYTSLQAAIDEAKDGDIITLTASITESFTVVQEENVNITIDGDNHIMTGSITVNGKSAAYATAGLTIKNVNFDATGITTEACINLGVKDDNNTRYTSNVTVENCTFTGGDKAKVAVKSYTGGDKKLTITNSTVDNTMHSLLQANNIAGVVIDNCTVNSKNGINLKSSSDVEIKNSTINVSGYAVRIGVDGGTSGAVTLTGNILKTDNSDGNDAVVVIRGTAAELVDLTMSENVVSGDTHISGTTAKTQISANKNYWDGKSAPVVSGTAVEVDTYYKDEKLTQLGINILIGSGTEEDPYLISSVDELLWFQEKVDEQASDGSTQFAGKYFKLTADIDLAGINWNPIGSMSGDHGSFMGVFDGDEHTISNLNAQQAGNGLGLFARTTGKAVIKNLTLNNVTVKSTDNSNYVGSVVGNAYASTKIENVHVTGNIDISGRGYIGGIAGHGYVVMDNVSVVGTGTINSTFWCAGGILGYGGEGTTNIMNAHVEGVTITSAAGGLGAIVGMAEDNGGTQPISGSNLSAKNVKIKTYTGAYGDSYANYALGYLYGGNETSKLTGDLKVENVEITTSSGETPSVVDAIAQVGNAIYFDLQSAVNAGGGVTVLRDVTLTDTLTIPAGKTVTLDLNGKTISQTKEQTAGYQMILNDGSLTIEDKVGGGKISYTDSGNGGEYISDTIYNRGTLVINGGTIENLSSATVASNGYPHAVDTYSGIRDTSTTIKDGTISCENYSAIRMFCVSATNKADLVINGGTIKGAVDMQNGTKVAALGSLTVNGGTFKKNASKGNIRFANWNGGATEYGITASIKGGSFDAGIVTTYVPAAANWNSKIISGGTFSSEVPEAYCAEGYIPTANDDGTYGVKVGKYVARVDGVGYETLQAAIDAAQDGGTVTLLDNVTLSEILVLDKAITLDGNGKTLTSTAARAINVSGADGVTIKNLTIKASGERAINVIQGATNLTVENVTATAANYTVNVAGSASNAVVTIKDSTLNGLNVVNVAGAGANVVIDSTVITCNDNSAVEGYSAVCLNKDAKNGRIVATNTTITVNDDSVKATNGAEGGVVTIDGSTDGVVIDVAYIAYGDYYYGFSSVEAAIEKAKTGETVTLIRDVSIDSKLSITKAITLDGNDKTLTYTGSNRAIDIPNNADAKVDVTIKNLKVAFNGYSERGINYNDDGVLTLESVTVNAEGKNVTYALNMPGSSDNATVVIDNSNISGNIALNVWGENATITANGTVFTSVDTNTAENYAAVKLNNDGTTNANGTKVTINGGKIIAKDENGEESIAVSNGTETGEVIVSDTTEVTGSISTVIAIVTYTGTDNFYSFSNLQDAVNKAAENTNTTVKLIRNVTANKIISINGVVTIDLNGKKLIGPDVPATSSYYAFIVDGGALTLKDSVGTGEIWAKCYGVETKSGTFTMESGTITATNNKTLGTAVVNYGGTVVIKGGTLTGAAQPVYTGGYFSDASTTINGGTLTGPVVVEDWADKEYTETVSSSSNIYETEEDYKWVEQDGVYVLTAKVYVAQIGETKYETLAEAVDAANAGDTVTLLADIELTESVVIYGKTLTLNFATYTITDKSTEVRTSDDDVWGMIEVKNNSVVTVIGSGKMECNFKNVPKTDKWTGMAYCINVDDTSKLTVNSGTFINGNGGIQTSGEVTVDGGTFVSHNGGTCIMANGSKAKVTVNNGTFKDSVEESDLYTGSGAVWGGFGATIDIKGGTYKFNPDPENKNIVWTLFPAQNAIAGYGENANMSVSGGTFYNFNPETDVVVDYSASAGFTFGSVVAEGYASLPNLDGNYVVGEEPTATVNNLGSTIVPAGEYGVWDGSSFDTTTDVDMPLSFVMQFLADQDAEDMANSPYADWYGDFVITFTGIENGSFIADGCYLAGHYGSFGWVKVPVDRMKIEDGVRYPVMLGVGLGQKYDYICSGVEDFKCALYLTPEILAANPNINVKLELTLVDDSKGSGEAAAALVSNENVYKVTDYTYDASDFAAPVAKIEETYYTSFTKALEAAKDGDTITLLKPVVVNAGETLTLDKAVTITYTSDVPGEDMFTNKGKLVVDGATLIYNNTDTTASNVTVSTISTEPGSVLEVKSGVVKNDSADNGAKGIYAYAIDILTNGNQGDVIATISGGEVVSTNYMAIRQFNNGEACKNILNVTGGKIYGAKRAIQVHLKNNAAYTNISDGEIEGGVYSLCFLTTSVNLSVTGGKFIGDVWYSGTTSFISGGTFDKKPDEAYVVKGYVAEEDANGAWTVKKDLFKLLGTQVIAGNALDMQFAIPENAVSDWSGHYATIVRTYADGRPNDEFVISATDWVYNTTNKIYVVTYTDLAAKEMCDEITVVIYDVNGEQVSYAWTDSMRDYAMRRYTQVNDDMKAVFVDMLNYGASVQMEKNYGVDDLANSRLTDEQKQYAGKYYTEAKNTLDQGDKWVGSRLITEGNIKHQIAFKGVMEDMYATVAFTSHTGTQYSETIDYDDMLVNSNYRVVEVGGLVVADARQTITVTIYNADGSVYTVCEDSIEACAARVKSEAYYSFMKFADSTYAYLHRNDG